MPSINEVATQRVFKGLTCAYTGKEVSVRVIAAGGSRPWFFSPEAFDPSLPMDSLPELLKQAGTRNGIVGAVSPEEAMVCPYTGDKMSIHEASGRYSLLGGFRPSCPCSDPAMYAFQMRMRGGKSPGALPEPTAEVTFIERPPAVSVGSANPRDSSLEYAEDALKHILPKKTTMAVTAPAPRRRKKA